MKSSLLFLLLLCSSIRAEIGLLAEQCSSHDNLWGTIASDYAIPDYFPLENELLRSILVNPNIIDLSRCEEDFSRAYLGNACVSHDQCYSTIGNSKSFCDNAMLYRSGDFCPSCEAYERAQREAAHD